MGLDRQDLKVTDGVLLAITAIITGISTFCQARRSKSLQGSAKRADLISAYLIVTTFFSVIALTAISRHSSNLQEKNAGVKVPYGPEGDEIMVPYAASEEPNKLNYVVFLLQTLALWLVKGAYLSTFYTLGSSLNRRIRLAIFGLAAFMGVSYLTTFFVDLFWCGNPKGVFKVMSECSPYDIPPFSVKFAMAISTDLALFALGLFLTVYLRRRGSPQIFLLPAIFSIGLMSIIASCFRYAYNYKFTVIGDINYIMANASNFSFWMKAEIIFAVVAYGGLGARDLVTFGKKKEGREKESMKSGSSV